jgi:hypothetical protein
MAVSGNRPARAGAKSVLLKKNIPVRINKNVKLNRAGDSGLPCIFTIEKAVDWPTVFYHNS